MFHLEILVEQDRITGLRMDFRCSGDPWFELEAWLTEQVGTERTFAWGKAERIEYPKFCVPLISIYYKKG